MELSHSGLNNKQKTLKILGIETSCDETSAAVVQASDRMEDRILSNVVLSQIKQHQPYGGVVPELAARSHIQSIRPVIEQALLQAHTSLEGIDAVAVTAGPGLIGGVLVGLMTAKALALSLDKPFIAVNHLEGHALTPRLSHGVSFPYLLLLASGGHCQFLEVHGVGSYKLLGATIDDAAGEAFDKVASCLGLDYPGGPAIEALALEGDPLAFKLPIPLKGRKEGDYGCHMSFSGLKTATRLLIEKHAPLTHQMKAHIAASFQHTVSIFLAERLEKAINLLSTPVQTVVLAGGVASNKTVGGSLRTVAEKRGLDFVAPPLSLCTDNGAMIAWAGLEKFQKGQISPLDTPARPRWDLWNLGSQQ